MAPVKKHKQSLLPIFSFIKQPNRTTLKVHDKLEKRNGLTSSPACKSKPRIDKKAQQRRKDEQAITEGGEKWRQYMEAKGFDDAERHDPRLLFQVYGPAPDPEADSSSEEENPIGGDDEAESTDGEDFRNIIDETSNK